MPRMRSAPGASVGASEGGGGGPDRAIDAALLEEWALAYLGRYASTAENLRQVLSRRVRRRLAAGGSVDREGAAAVEPLIEALVQRYRETGLVNDAAYAAGRARRGMGQGRSLRRIAAGLAAKGVGAADAAAAIAGLRDEATDPELAAAAAFARRRRLGPFRREPHPRGDAPNLHMAELAAFARAGFSRRTAEAVLACPDGAAVQALLADDDTDGAGSD
jgi:regulatory protein